ncbi:hypothetical protein [Bosea vaviloviae]|uniref:Uncharacterized protein n=1 Tax=Bosea vaviloviae TaxID=1526658 RepID=A0A1D7U2T2_9HYPH|nr:hypothetical protein [Bosea vaviloviae]AOO81667.1 hypothetical protein BHK69_15470 [Bosea vaviloviae]
MAGAAYQVNVSATDDETFAFTCEWTLADGSDFPWADYAYAYELKRERRPVLSLTSSDGLAVDASENTITFQPPEAMRLCAGRYRHGCRITHTATGKTIQVFDGFVTITEGNF